MRYTLHDGGVCLRRFPSVDGVAVSGGDPIHRESDAGTTWKVLEYRRL